MDGQRIRERFAAARAATLATVRPDGSPHLVPVCFALLGESVVTAVDQKPKRSPDLTRLANIRANPAVEVLVHHYGEEWSRLWWIRLRGRAAVLESGDRREAGLAALLAKYPQYEQRPPQGPVIEITPESWSSWSATGLW